MKVLICTNADNLERALAGFKYTATVEAEYGDRVVEGSILTLAHHGDRKANPCPCSARAEMLVKAAPLSPSDTFEAVGISHFDLDTIGGVAAIMGIKPKCPRFWELAEFVDLNGAHKLHTFEFACDAEKNALTEMMNAWWAWSKTQKFLIAGLVLECTGHIQAAVFALSHIVEWIDKGQAEASPETCAYIRNGRDFAEAEEKLNVDSLHEFGAEGGRCDGVVSRVSTEFVNHLYSLPDGERHFRACVALNTTRGMINVSLAEPIPGVSARTIVQSLWGPLAGGHDTIAGSPRGLVMNVSDLEDAFEATAKALNPHAAPAPFL